MTRPLLTVTALLEGATGIALLAAPAVPVALLLGAALDTPGGLTVGRVAGAAVLSLGLACGWARLDGQSRSGRAMVAAMLVYNLAVVAVLVQARIGLGVAGVGFWPAAFVHTAMAAWCIGCLWLFNPSQGERTQ